MRNKVDGKLNGSQELGSKLLKEGLSRAKYLIKRTLLDARDPGVGGGKDKRILNEI
jgi:hypothetical protein